MKYTRRRYKTRKNVRRKTRRGGAFANRGRGGAFANRGRAHRNADCREFLAKPVVIAFMKQYLKKKSGKFNPTLEDLKRVEIKFDELKEAYPDLASCYLDRYQMKSARNTWIDQLFPGKNQNVKAVKLNALKNLPRLPARGPVVAPVASAASVPSPAASAIVASPAASVSAVEAVSDANADVNAETEAPILFSTVNPKVAARLAAARRGTPPDPTHTVVAPTSAAAQHLNALELNAERGEAPTGVAAQHLNALAYNAENPPGEDLISELRNEQLGRTGIQEYKDLFQYVNGESMTRVVNTFNFEIDEGLLFRIAKFLMLLYDEYYSGVYENDEDDTLASYAHFLSPLSTKVDDLLRNNRLPGIIKNEIQNLKNILPAPEGYFENVDG